MKAMREALTALGYNCSIYAGHSFRIGAATVAGCKIPLSIRWDTGRVWHTSAIEGGGLWGGVAVTMTGRSTGARE